jgi:NADH:ubiquinone oxidoreductase subunit 6 (subunit J)
MDSLHAIGFYVSSGVSVIGGLGVALLPGREQRGISLAIAGAGLAGIYVSLGAGFAAIVALVCYVGCAVMVAGPRYRVIQTVTGTGWRQVGAIGAGASLALLAFSAFRGDFVQAKPTGDGFAMADVGRLLFAHDALATDAVAVLVVVSLAGAFAVWRRARERAR